MPDFLRKIYDFLAAQAAVIDGRLKVYLASIMTLSFCLMVAIAIGEHQHRVSVHTIGVDAEPSVVAANNIMINVQDVAANFANALMDAQKGDADVLNDIRKTETILAGELVKAGQGITYGEAEARPLRQLQDALFQLERLMGGSLFAHDYEGKDDLAQFQQASKLLKEVIMPAARNLEQANDDALEAQYRHQTTEAWLTFGAVALFACLVLWQLFSLNNYIRNHYHRKNTTQVLGAIALVFLGAGYTLFAFGMETHHISVARNDAYQSVKALYKMRSRVFEMNNSESEYLLDSANKSAHTAYYQGLLAEVGVPQNKSYQSVVNELQTAIGKGQQFSFKVSGFAAKTSLAAELDNVTFDGELEAGLEVVRDLDQYNSIDLAIRKLEENGKHKEALEMCVGVKPGQSNFAFAQLDKDLVKIIKINQDPFDNAIQSGFRWLLGIYEGALALFFATVVLIVFAVKPRLAEFPY